MSAPVALSADLAQLPKTVLTSGATGKEQWIGNPQDAELGRPQSAESAIPKLEATAAIVGAIIGAFVGLSFVYIVIQFFEHIK